MIVSNTFNIRLIPGLAGLASRWCNGSPVSVRFATSFTSWWSMRYPELYKLITGYACHASKCSKGSPHSNKVITVPACR